MLSQSPVITILLLTIALYAIMTIAICLMGRKSRSKLGKREVANIARDVVSEEISLISTPQRGLFLITVMALSVISIRKQLNSDKKGSCRELLLDVTTSTVDNQR